MKGPSGRWKLAVQVFPELTGQVFDDATRSPLDAFVEGPTASGKTHTLQGPLTDPGIVPRSLDRLFKLHGLSRTFCSAYEYLGL